MQNVRHKSNIEKKNFKRIKTDAHVQGKGLQNDLDWKTQIETTDIIGSDEIKIVAWNVNGLRSVLKPTDDNKAIFLAYLEKESPDIITLSETKLNAKIAPDYIHFAKNYIFFHECHNKPGYAGVAIGCKLTILESLPKITYHISKADYKVIHDKPNCLVVSGIKNKELDKESRVITMYMNNLIFIGCYSMNSGQGLKRLDNRINLWDKEMFNYVKELEQTYKIPVIWAGDLNIAKDEIDVWNSKANAKFAGHTKEERASFNEFLQNSVFIDIYRYRYPNVRRYTWWPSTNKTARNNNLGWRLDLFVLPKTFETNVTICSMRDALPGSDHVPIILGIKKHVIFD